MKKAWYGTNSLVVLSVNLGASILHLAGIFPYFFTLFFPLFSLLGGMMGAVGFFEKDKSKWQGLVAMVLGFGGGVLWIVLFLVRLKGGR